MRGFRGATGLLAATGLVVRAMVAGAAAPPKGTVVVDQGHRQRFTVEGNGPLDLSALAQRIRVAGAQVRPTRTALAGEVLRGAQGLVISGAFAPLTRDEVDAVVAFVEAGGRVAVMLHIGPPVDALLDRLGVSISNGVVRERQGLLGDDPLNFKVTRMGSHAITRGVESFAVHGAWALLPRDGSAGIAMTGPHAWVDLNGDGQFGSGDAMQAFAVAVSGERGTGAFVVFGDDAVFQNQFLEGGNLALAGNLGRWLVGQDGGAAPGGVFAVRGTPAGHPGGRTEAAITASPRRAGSSDVRGE